MNRTKLYETPLTLQNNNDSLPQQSKREFAIIFKRFGGVFPVAIEIESI